MQMSGDGPLLPSSPEHDVSHGRLTAREVGVQRAPGEDPRQRTTGAGHPEGPWGHGSYLLPSTSMGCSLLGSPQTAGGPADTEGEANVNEKAAESLHGRR